MQALTARHPPGRCWYRHTVGTAADCTTDAFAATLREWTPAETRIDTDAVGAANTDPARDIAALADAFLDEYPDLRSALNTFQVAETEYRMSLQVLDTTRTFCAHSTTMSE